MGSRSCGPMRPAMTEGFEYLAQANAQIACVLMIETEQGLDNVDAIAAVDGVDALFVGPMDLCYGLGLPPGDFGNTRVKDAIATITQACARHGLAAGMFGYTPELARASLNGDFTFASAGTDISFFRAGLADGLAAARGQDAARGEPKAGY